MNSRALKVYTIDDKYRMAELKAYAMQYESCQRRINDAIVYSNPSLNRNGGTGKGRHSDFVADAAARIEKFQDRCTNIEKALRLCHPDPEMQRAVQYAVTKEEWNFNRLKTHNLLFYERDAFYLARQRFYYELNKMI